MQEAMMKRAKELLTDGTVNRVLGWQKGEFAYDATPAVFHSAEALEQGFVYDDFTAANLSKYLVKETKNEGKVLVFLKPCDTYSLNQLTKEHRVNRDNVYVIGVGCDGKADVEKLRAKGVDGILGITADGDNFVVETLYGNQTIAKADVLAERCVMCKSRKLMTYDEILQFFYQGTVLMNVYSE